MEKDKYSIFDYLVAFVVGSLVLYFIFWSVSGLFTFKGAYTFDKEIYQVKEK